MVTAIELLLSCERYASWALLRLGLLLLKHAKETHSDNAIPVSSVIDRHLNNRYGVSWYDMALISLQQAAQQATPSQEKHAELLVVDKQARFECFQLMVAACNASFVHTYFVAYDIHSALLASQVNMNLLLSLAEKNVKAISTAASSSKVQKKFISSSHHHHQNQ